MHRGTFLVGLMVMALLTPAVLALREVSAQVSPSGDPTTRPGAAAQQDLSEAIEDAKTWARWGCILAGLALLGVLWIGYSMQTLAKNQVQLGRMIQAGGEK